MEIIYNLNCLVAEGPLWDEKRKKLFWTDILGKKIYSYDETIKKSETVLEGLTTGAMVSDINNNLILLDDKGLKRLFLDEQGNKKDVKKIADIPMAEDERFNDAITDGKGRIIAGTMTDRLEDGKLYIFEKNKPPRILLKNLGISNGMVFIEQGNKTYLYHTDSKAMTITRYAYNKEKGEISFPEKIYQGKEEDGLPDGMTKDINNNLYIAFWGGSKILITDKNGKKIDEIKVPAVQVSSICFGGENMDYAYITTASAGSADTVKGLDENGIYLGGKVFRADSGTKGLTEFRADI